MSIAMKITLRLFALFKFRIVLDFLNAEPDTGVPQLAHIILPAKARSATRFKDPHLGQEFIMIFN